MCIACPMNVKVNPTRADKRGDSVEISLMSLHRNFVTSNMCERVFVYVQNGESKLPKQRYRNCVVANIGLGVTITVAKMVVILN